MKLLADRQIIEVSGEDRTIFLQNLITNDLRDLSEKKISHTFILNHLGKIIFEFYIHYTSECLLLDCNYASADELIKKLMMYKLRSKIVLRSREDLSVYWEESKIIFPKDPRNNGIGSRKINVKKSIISQNDASNYDHFRIKLGIAEINKDFLPSDIFAHELNDYVNSIQFALTTISPLSSREIIDFSHREKNHSYYYLCEKNWQNEYLENASINKGPFKRS